MSVTATSDPLMAWRRLRAGAERITILDRGTRGIDEQPIAAVFRCSDSGVPGETMFGQSPGSLMDVCTWGHVVDRGVLAALEYAVEFLDVPLIVVLGHTDCRAMRTAMRAWDEVAMPDGAMRSVVEHVIGSIVNRGADARSVESVTSAHVVETGLGLLERSPVIARRVDAGRCAIVCATADPSGHGVRLHATLGAVGEVDDQLMECV